MATAGAYLAYQIRGLAGQTKRYLETIFEHVVPVFNNLDERAEKVQEDYYNAIARQPTEYEIDMADVAEDAEHKAVEFYDTMRSVRQTMLNLLASGLFHLVEQLLAHPCRDAAFEVESELDPPNDTKLGVVQRWYEK